MYAAFLQASIGDQVAQIMVVPVGPAQGASNHTTFFRVTRPGARGASVRWEDFTYGEAAISTSVGGWALDREPVAVKVTDSDVAQIIERGSPTTLGSKAMMALTRRPVPDPAVLVRDIMADLPGDVDAQSPRLLSWFQDGRSQRASTPRPVTPTVSTPVIPTVQVPVQTEVLVEEPALRMATVPGPEIASAYVHRRVYGTDDFTIFETAQAARENVLIKGPTGAAKTMSVLAFAASKGLPVFTISGSINFEPSEALGQTMLDSTTGLPYFQYGGAVEVVRGGGVLILDEINFIPGKVITPLFPLLDDRREIVLKQNKGEVIKAHPNLLIVGTMNPGYMGTQSMNFALVNRFDHHLDWGYDDEVEKRLVPSKSIRDFAKQLREMEAAKRIVTPTPTNALMSIVQNAQALGLDYALANFISRYDDSEQKAVQLALDALRANIESDLGLAAAPVVETVEVTTDSLSDMLINA